jgi:hypothetical protein
MIAFLYPKEDWTAADIALKVQAVAASQDIEVYSVPKYQQNRREQIYQKLSKVSHAIFIARDIKTIDPDTREHLNYLKDKGKDVYFLVPAGMESEAEALGFQRNIRTYDPANPMAILQIAESLLTDLRQQADAEGLAIFIVLVGMLLLILYLALSAAKK